MSKFLDKNGKEVKNDIVKVEGEGVGKYSRKIICKFNKLNVSNDVMSKMVKEKYKNSKVDYKHIGWYKGDMKKRGISFW